MTQASWGIFTNDLKGFGNKNKLAEHKELMRKYEFCDEMEEALKEHIETVLDFDWLAEINDEILRFTNVTSLKMITHLCNHGGNLDFVNTKELLTEYDGPWNIIEHTTVYFNHFE